MTSIYLFRHGLTKEAEDHLYCGKTDVPLSKKGIDLLQEEKKLVPKLSDYSIYSSGMLRCDMTVEVLYPGLAYKREPSLREIGFGIFECHSYEQLKDNPEYQAWISGRNEMNVCPGGESGIQMKERVLAFVKKILLKEKEMKLAIFTHGGPIVALMQYFFPHEHKNFYEWQCGFGQGYKILLDKKNASYEKLEFNKEIK